MKQFFVKHNQTPRHAISSTNCWQWTRCWDVPEETTHTGLHYRQCRCEPPSYAQIVQYLLVTYLVGQSQFEEGYEADGEDGDGCDKCKEAEEDEESRWGEEENEDYSNLQTRRDWCKLSLVSVHWARIFRQKVHETSVVLSSKEDVTAFDHYSTRPRPTRFPGIIDYRKRPVISKVFSRFCDIMCRIDP